MEEKMWLIRDKYPEVAVTVRQDRLELLEAYSGMRFRFFCHPAGASVWAGFAGFCTVGGRCEMVPSELVRLREQVPPPEHVRFPGETRESSIGGSSTTRNKRRCNYDT